MFDHSRRSFLAASLGGLAAAPALAQTKPVDPKASVEDATFQPTTLFLTWHRDPTTTMDIQWVGTLGETSDFKVYYRPVSSPFPVTQAGVFGPLSAVANQLGWQPFKTTTHQYPMTDFKVFRAQLSGLKPGTDYEFRIGRSSPTYRFRTMPAKATDTIHFVSGGDCGVNSHAVANNIQAARQDPMFAVIGGDLGYDNGRSVEVSLAFIRNYSRTMIAKDGRMIPLIAGIGNHEVDGGYGKSRAKAPFFFALFDGLYPDTGHATLDFGDYLSLVMLDTGHTSAIEGDQTDWLAKTLKDRRDHPNVIAVNHVPAYPSFRAATVAGKPGTGTGEGNRKHWVPLFEQFRVPVVLEHHDHTFKRTKPLLNGSADANGVQYLGDGSWGRLRSVNSPAKLDYLATSASDYHLSLHRIQGEQRFHLALDENGRVMDVAHSGQRTTGLVRAGG